MARLLTGADFIYRAPRGALPHVVLLPGLTAGRWMWEPTLRALDAAGYGYLTLVDAMAHEYDQAAPITASVAELMDRCEIASAVMVGGSFGSRIALDYALACPERIAMVALSGAPGAVTTGNLGVSFQGKATRAFCAALLDIIFYDRRLVPEGELNATLELFHDQRRVLNAMRLMKECAGYDYAGALARIDSSVLMIWGVHDRISPCSLWERALAPNARQGSFFKIERCGHVPMIERPQTFNALLLDRLAPVSS